MKKFFAVFMAVAAIALVGCKKNDASSDTPQIKSDVPEVAAQEGVFTIVWNAVNYSECNPLVFAGNYNGYALSVDELESFEPLEGYKNWYVLRIDADAYAIDQLDGKPCALNSAGEFSTSWDNQWIGTAEHPCEIVKGEAEFVTEYEVETKLVIAAPGGVVYVRSWAFKVDPCVEEELYEVTFNLSTVEAIPSDAVVNIVGNFPDASWDPTALEMTRVDDNHFTYTHPGVALGKGYKYVVNGSWDNEVYWVAPEAEAECITKEGDRTISDVEMNDAAVGFINITTQLQFCKDEPGPVDVEVAAGDVITIKVACDADLSSANVLYAYNWGITDAGFHQMTYNDADGLYTYQYTVNEADVNGWKNSGILFVDADNWDDKSGQTADIKPIHSGVWHIDANWNLSEDEE